MTAKETRIVLEEIIKIGSKSNVSKIKLGEVEVCFRKKEIKTRVRRSSPNEKTMEQDKKQAMMDEALEEMRILNPLQYEETIALGKNEVG